MRNLLLAAIVTETICAQGNDGDRDRALLEEKSMSLPYADYMDSLSFSYAGIPNSDKSAVNSEQHKKLKNLKKLKKLEEVLQG